MVRCWLKRQVLLSHHIAAHENNVGILGFISTSEANFESVLYHWRPQGGGGAPGPLSSFIQSEINLFKTLSRKHVVNYVFRKRPSWFATTLGSLGTLHTNGFLILPVTYALLLLPRDKWRTMRKCTDLLECAAVRTSREY